MKEKVEILGGFPVVDARLVIPLDPSRSSVRGLVDRYGNPVRTKQVLTPVDGSTVARWATRPQTMRGMKNPNSIGGKVWDAVNGVSPEAFVIRTSSGMLLVDPVKVDNQGVDK